MRIAHLSAEVAPFAKSGGLGDVVGALPKAQAALGNEVSVFMPLYREARAAIDRLNIEVSVATDPFMVGVGPQRFEVGILRGHLPGSSVPVYFVGSDENFDRPSIYSPDYFGRDDGIVRYSLFVRAALSAMERLWIAPDILHAHDWHAALGPMALAWDEPANWVFGNTRSVFTIHNLAFQGTYPASAFGTLGLPPAKHGWAEWDGAVNLLKGALASAAAITTVSPTYSREIMTPAQGFGLDPILRMRSRDVIGILNGIDPSEWDPSRDPHIRERYDVDTLNLKGINRRALLTMAGMDPDDPGLVVGAVGRLTAQKGWDLFLAAADDLLQRGVRFVILGSGETRYEQALASLSHRAQSRAWAYVGFREDLAHQIEAGADAFLMPSIFEPCGLNQMYSLRYGTPPIVRRTGGLADSVVPYTGYDVESATGFAFDDATPAALRDTVTWAQMVHRDRDVWNRIARNGMTRDVSWTRSARQYQDVYEAVRR